MSITKDRPSYFRFTSKKRVLTRISTIMLILLTSWNLSAAAVVVEFKSGNLESVVRLFIGKPTGDILDTDLVGTGFTTLSASFQNISFLDGLEYCTDLETLNLSGNVPLVSLTPIINLPNLKVLELNRCDLDFQADISVIANMTTLTHLELYDNDLTDITFVENMTNLEHLILYENAITDITPLENLSNLEYLDLYFNSITDIAPLAGKTNLINLYLDRNQITDLSPLAASTNLISLGLYKNDLTDLTGLENMSQLEFLDASVNDLTDLTAIDNLTNLIGLYLEDCNFITDITPVENLVNLEYLYLSSNWIEDITPVSGLTNLIELSLDANNISDISALDNLINLAYLGLYYNNIRDISPLVANTGLATGDFIDLDYNPLNSAAICSPSALVDILIARGASVNYGSECGGDSDSDGMPDEWEGDYGLNPFTNDAADDLDGDGVSNYDEYIAGTNPSLHPGTWLDLNALSNGLGTQADPFNLISTALNNTADNGNLYVIGGVLEVPVEITQPLTILFGPAAL